MNQLPGHPIEFTDEELARVTHLAELNFGPGEIAVLLKYKKAPLKKLLLNEEHPMGLAYLKGKLLAQETKRAAVNLSIETGNITAVQIYQKDAEQQRFSDIRDEIFDL